MSERLLTAAELADRLALSTSTVLDLFGSGRLPEFKFGRVVRFSEDDVLDWIEAPARPACHERTTCIGPDRGAKREVPYEVAREGGLPTHEEFEGVWTAFANVPPRFRVVWPVTERLGYRE